MTPSELKHQVETGSPYYFSRKTMQFFGDTMKNYGVQESSFNGIICWELYRKKPVKHGIQTSHYFNKDSFEFLG